MIQRLKIEPAYFEAVSSWKKTFEIRYNDRDYKVGDLLVLREWDGEKYTGREVDRVVSYVSHYAQQTGYVVLALWHPNPRIVLMDSQP